MAINITAEITGQEITSVFTYCYLYEPLRILIEETNLAATKFYIDIEIVDTLNSATIVQTLLKYAEYDINSGNTIKVDLMKIAQQIHDANVFRYGEKASWGVSTLDGVWEPWHSVVSKYRYNFKIYSNLTTTPVEIKKLPIIGGRDFKDFTALVPVTQPLTEWSYYGLPGGSFVFPYPPDDSDQSLKYRWGNVYSVDAVLNANPNGVSAQPNTGTSSQDLTHYSAPCAGGFLIWKSRFGGWLHWGFDIQTKSKQKTYDGNLEVGQFEGQAHFQRDSVAFVEVDYTGVQFSHTRTLKSLSLRNSELEAVAGIEQSPAVYYVDNLTHVSDDPGIAELMRVTAVSAPYDTKAEGGNFTVTLKSISKTGMKTK